jgi:hypothetical protein
MSNKKITVKRRNNMKKVANNPVNQLLKALKKPLAQKSKRPPSKRSTQGKIAKAISQGGYAQNATVFAPAAFGSKTKVSKAAFGGGRTLIRHSEYIADINGSVGFATPLVLNCNPGLQANFPWLAQIANAYEKFIVKSIEYRFATEAPTSTTGSVFLSPEYNPQDSAPLSKQETFQNEDTVRTVPWEDVGCKIPTKYLRVYNEYFVRAGTLPVNQDLKTYDPLIMYVCTQGQANANLVGEIWVDYEIELINPQGNLNPASGAGIVAAGSTAAHIFAGLVTYGPLSIVASATTNVLTLSAMVIGQEYQITVGVTGTNPNVVESSITGATVITSTYDGFESTTAGLCVVTFTATAQVVTVTYTSSTATTQTVVSVLAIPIGAF